MTDALDSYDLVGLEYYDSIRHPTCANFRTASAYLLTKWFAEFFRAGTWICEVGVGRSLAAEMVENVGGSLNRLLLTDVSSAMIAHSARWARDGAPLVLADAEALPIDSGALSLLVASVADPFNRPSFWREVARTLSRGSIALFTTPSYDWATAFRGSDNGNNTAAEFEVVSGKRVLVPSFIYPPERQISMIEGADLSVDRVVDVPISALNGERLSPKLIQARGPSASVLTGYVILHP